MRLNIDKKIVEHAEPITDEKEQEDLELEQGVVDKVPRQELPEIEDLLLEYDDKVKFDYKLMIHSLTKINVATL